MIRPAVLLAAFGLALPAEATVFTRTFSIVADFHTASGDVYGDYAQITGTFQVTFDTADDTYAPTTDGVVVSDFTLPYSIYYRHIVDQDGLLFGNTLAPPGEGGGFSPSSHAYAFEILHASTDPTGLYFAYANGSNIFEASSITVTAPPVPEAPVWAMMIGGMGLAGGVMRRSRRARVRFA